MNKEEINKFNKNLKNSWDQGIFTEPTGIPNHIKEPVLYLRYKTGGIDGGSCWENSNPQPYTVSNIEDNWEALDNYLLMKCPHITFMQYKKIENSINSSKNTQWEYYGNCTNYVIKYIELSKLDKIIESFSQN